MALQHGKDGGVYEVTTISGSTVTVKRIAETTSWSITTTREFGEIRKHGAEWVKRLGGIRDWSASVEAIMDMTSNQTILVDGVYTPTLPGTVVLALYAAGNNASGSATLPRWQGTAYVNNVVANSPANDLQAMTIDFVGEGTLQLISGN